MRSMQDNKYTFELQEEDNGDEKDPLNQQPVETVDVAPPVQMPAIGHTLEFPRKDNVYKKKEALPFDEANSLVWKRAFRNDWRENLKHWGIYITGGIAVGITAFGMSQLEELLVNSNRILLQYVIDVYTDHPTLEILLPIISYCSIAAILGLTAGLLTVYYGPGANGSGVAEMIGYMNGINYPEFIGINTLITKIVGVTLAVSSRLCIGKEGPLAHIGSIMGILPAYLPFESVKTLQNDYTKRQLIAAGGSAGVAAAFGAPIGGALFAYEMSKPTSFWNFSMIWKTFITCSLAVLVLGMLQTLADNKGLSDGFTGSTVKFGSITQNNEVNSYQNLLGAIIIGIVGGLLGAFFVGVNFKMNAWRKVLLKSKWIKPLETSFWSILTTLLFVLVPYLMWSLSDGGVCLEMSTLQSQDQRDRVYRGWCGDGRFDPNLSLFLASEGDIIRNIMDQTIEVQYQNMVIFLLVWYLLTITTYGTFVPAGLFLPGMIIGCALGDVLYNTMNYGSLIVGDDATKSSINKNYIVLGCAGFMAGYTRMTYSLAVIIMETANDIQIFLPIMITITVSNYIAYFFTRSLYERAIRGKQMPLIRDWIPGPCQKLVAENIMCKQVVTLQNVCKLSDVKKAIATKHHAFPILNSKGNFVGILPRNFLLILLQERHFYGSIDGIHSSEKQEYTSSKVMSAQALNKEKGDNSRSSQGGFAILQYKLNDDVQGSQDVKKYFSTYFDVEVYPPTPDEKLLHWTKFTRNFWSVDLPVTAEHQQICEYNESAMLDLRPYLIETPMRVMTTDYLFKCVEYMRRFHMRHIPVLHPSDGKLRGIITRQDLFKWLDS